MFPNAGVGLYTCAFKHILIELSKFPVSWLILMGLMDQHMYIQISHWDNGFFSFSLKFFNFYYINTDE